MQMKVIIAKKNLHFVSFWNWEFLELRNGLRPKQLLLNQVHTFDKIKALKY